MTLFGKFVLAVFLIIIGSSVYFFTNRTSFVADDSSTKSVSLEPVATSSAPVASKKIAFSEFMKQTGSYKCDVSQSVQNVETKGTVYMNDGMVRGEFATVVAGQNIETTFIVRDGYSYTWTSAMKGVGYKVKSVAVASESTTTAKTSGTYSFNGEQIGDYDCKEWTPDGSLFTIPTSVKFQMIPQ